LKPLLDWYLRSLETGDYWLVALLVAVDVSARHAAERDRNSQGHASQTGTCAANATAS
jgi:hypothetical protein